MCAPVILALFVLQYIHKTYTVYSKHISRHCSVLFYHIISSPFHIFSPRSSFLFTPLIFSFCLFYNLVSASELSSSQAFLLSLSSHLTSEPSLLLYSHFSFFLISFTLLLYISFSHLISLIFSHPFFFSLLFLASVSHLLLFLVSSDELTVRAALSQFGREAFLMESIFQSSE